VQKARITPVNETHKMTRTEAAVFHATPPKFSLASTFNTRTDSNAAMEEKKIEADDGLKIVLAANEPDRYLTTLVGDMRFMI
jgi:hypothetical protein